MPLADARVTRAEPLDNGSARWLRLLRLNYTHPDLSSKTWESCERLTRPASDLDSVGVVALMSATGSAPLRVVLQKQFRPPVGKVCVEFPAGLLDEGETAEECAVRELREETGYQGEVLPGEAAGTGVMFNDPGFCNTNVRMIHVTIDMSKPENQDPRPQLEEDEFIECFTVPLRDLYARCSGLEKEGYAIDARVYTLAEGIELAKRFGLS